MTNPDHIVPKSNDDYLARLQRARRMADEGYGWADLVVRCSIELDAAKNLVMAAEDKRRGLANDKAD